MKNKTINLKLNDKGFSILELLIVMAIIAILTGLSALSIAMVNNANVNKAAKDFESIINTSRTQSMAKGLENGKITLTYNNGELYAQVGTTGELTKITSKMIKVYYVVYANNSSYTDHPMDQAFGDGDTKEIEFTSSGVCSSTDDGICQLIFERGNRRVAVILYRETGKHLIQAF